MSGSRVALPAEGVDRNLFQVRMRSLRQRSPSPRRAWIEIQCLEKILRGKRVALPAEGVDRNRSATIRVVMRSVALPAEGVDRNKGGAYYFQHAGVSPSPRRAWIEIARLLRDGCRQEVALPTEGVDRNLLQSGKMSQQQLSPSPRRAWIEIIVLLLGAAITVSPSPRRAWIEMQCLEKILRGKRSRPPHGGRG